MNLKYSKRISELLKKNNNILLIPDLILVKEGIACGDKIIISGEVDNNIILFDFSTENACDLTKAVCNYLIDEYNDKDIKFVKDSVNNLYSKISSKHDYIFELFDLDKNKYYKRFDCLVSPIKLLISFIQELNSVKYTYDNKPDTHQNMACDACVGACRINWNNQKVEKKNHHGDKVYQTEYLKKWLPLGKIILNNEDKENLKNACRDMMDSDFQFLSDYTMNSFVYHHLLENYPKLMDKRWKASAYLIQKNEITMGYFEEVRKYIIEKKLDIYFIKGYVSQKYYENPKLRIHSDYDLIATNSKDAFKLTNYLLKNGFTIRPNLFSFKKMIYKDKEEISGHFHVQKIIDDTYMFELDISFPGFPINRVDLFYPKVENNEISTEDQIIVTLLHLFKHSNVYMKDINDIYYMLMQEIDFKYLKSRIIEYNLIDFFSLAFMYISKNFPLDMIIQKEIVEEFNINTSILENYPDWPYDMEMHLKIKQKDFSNRTQKHKEFERKYLFPVVIFKEEINFLELERTKEEKFEYFKILDTIYEIKYGEYIFYLTPIGIFIDNYINTSNISRRSFIQILNKFIELIGNKDFYTIPYATEHFYVRVI